MTDLLKLATSLFAIALAVCVGVLHSRLQHQEKVDYYNLATAILDVSKSAEISAIDSQINTILRGSDLPNLKVVEVMQDSGGAGFSDCMAQSEGTIRFKFNRPLTEKEHETIVSRISNVVYPHGGNITGATGYWDRKVQFLPFDATSEYSMAELKVAYNFSIRDRRYATHQAENTR